MHWGTLWFLLRGDVDFCVMLMCGRDLVAWRSFSFLMPPESCRLAGDVSKQRDNVCFNVPLLFLALQRRPSRCGFLRSTTRLCTHTCWTWRSDRVATSRASSPDCSPMFLPPAPPATSETLYICSYSYTTCCELVHNICDTPAICSFPNGLLGNIKVWGCEEAAQTLHDCNFPEGRCS